MPNHPAGRILAIGALFALLICTPALALDLNLEVATAKTTSIPTLTYGVGSVQVTVSGSDATTAQTLFLPGIDAGTYTLLTSYGDFDFTVASNGSLSVPTGSLLTVSGSKLTIQNTLDIPDFAIRMRNPTGLVQVTLRSVLRRPLYVGSFPNAAAAPTVTLDGDTADTPVSVPLLGMVPDRHVLFAGNLGDYAAMYIEADGSLSESTYSVIPLGFDSDEPETAVIENTVDLDGFAIRLQKPTTIDRVDYWILDWYGGFYFDPVTIPVVDRGYDFLTSLWGLTADEESAEFDMTGLAPNQLIQVRTSMGGVFFRVKSDGSLEDIGASSSMPYHFADSVLVIENTIDIPDFRLRHENSVNCSGFTYVLDCWSGYGRSWVGSPRVRTTTSATTELSYEILGLTPDRSFHAMTSLARAEFWVTSDGAVVLRPYDAAQPPDGYTSVGDDGEVTLTFLNPQDLWVRIYSDEAPTSVYWVGPWVRSATDPSALDFDGGRRSTEPEDYPTGEYFHLDRVGRHTMVFAGTDFKTTGFWNSVRIVFTLNPDGTAVFRSPATTLSPTKASMPVALASGETITMFVEIVDPPNAAPTVSLGDANLTILSSAQGTTVLTAAVADSDGDDLLVSWYVDGVLVAGPASPTDGESSLDLGTLDDLGVGDHVVRAEVSDGALVATGEIVLTVGSSPPVIAASGSGTYEIGEDSVIPLGGSVSDYDGEELAWSWQLADGTVIASGTVDTEAGGEPVDLPSHDLETLGLGLGTHTLWLVVQDEVNEPVVQSVEVEVVDTSAPTLAPVASHRLLWPPNHEMVDVTIDANAVDASGGAVTLEVAVTSDEPPEFDGSGSFLPDYEIVSVDSTTGRIELELRAERSGRGDGRTYTVTITATDASGNVSIATVEVKAPHDRGKK